tara:strand:+ start:15709 stop:16551 length:843 start_codon:yes stop_codon:yes gene_type:complete
MNKSKKLSKVKINTLLTLKPAEQKTLLTDLHKSSKYSISEIAEICDTYPNKIRRLAQKLKVPIRNKSEAQKVALQTGRHKHPTAGTKRDDNVKIKISEATAKNWDNMEEDERERRSEMARKQWENMAESERKEFHRKANLAIREAAQNGSKLEKVILFNLIKLGYKTQFHREHMLVNERLHLDLLLPELKVVIEIDGPSHFKPIWGQNAFSKVQQTDNKKNGLVLASGMCMIRIRQKKNLSNKLERDIIRELEECLEKIQKKFPTSGKRYFILGETDDNS